MLPTDRQGSKHANSNPRKGFRKISLMKLVFYTNSRKGYRKISMINLVSYRNSRKELVDWYQPPQNILLLPGSELLQSTKHFWGLILQSLQDKGGKVGRSSETK